MMQSNDPPSFSREYHDAFSLDVVSVFLLAEASAESTSERLVNDWLNLEIQKGQLRSNWNQREKDIEHRLMLMDIEQKRLEESVAQRANLTSDSDQRRLEYLEQQEVLEREQAELKTLLQKNLQFSQTLLPRLPPPLQADWKDKIELLSTSNLSNSESLQRQLEFFKAIEEFNSRVALHKGAIENPETRSIFVTQIYLGVSQGWNVSDDGKSYGYGRSTPLGWRWWHNEDAHQELGRELTPKMIADVLNIMENPTTAAFVALPIKVAQ